MKKQKIIIGRATTCDIVLGDMTVSRIHAELELLENKKLLLTDCHSSQGTFLIRNGIGEKVKQQIVSEHDQLKFGSIKISVRELLKETGLHGQNKVTVKPKEKVQNHQVAGQVNQDKIKKECLTDNKEEKESFSTLFFSLDGRIPRSTFWLKYMLPYLVIYIVLAVIDIATGSFDYSIGYGTYSAIFTLLAIIPTLAIGVKRCHDRNKPGWFLLMSFIPLLNLWMLVELWFLKGTSKNRYGPDPLL